jgi:PIN domain nuclease of toxin-antitoxin system
LILADTHAWLWWMTQGPRLSRSARAVLDAEDVVGVSAMSCWEIALLASRKRITLGLETGDWLQRALTRASVELLPLSPDVAVLAHSFGDSLHKDPVDRILVATALHYGVRIVTRDEKIQAFAGVESVW